MCFVCKKSVVLSIVSVVCCVIRFFIPSRVGLLFVLVVVAGMGDRRFTRWNWIIPVFVGVVVFLIRLVVKLVSGSPGWGSVLWFGVGGLLFSFFVSLLVYWVRLYGGRSQDRFYHTREECEGLIRGELVRRYRVFVDSFVSVPESVSEVHYWGAEGRPKTKIFLQIFRLVDGYLFAGMNMEVGFEDDRFLHKYSLNLTVVERERVVERVLNGLAQFPIWYEKTRVTEDLLRGQRLTEAEKRVQEEEEE